MRGGVRECMRERANETECSIFNEISPTFLIAQENKPSTPMTDSSAITRSNIDAGPRENHATSQPSTRWKRFQGGK